MTATQPHIQTWVASDGYVAHCRCYIPSDAPRAHLICLHGIQSHGGWYEYSSLRLCKAGYAVHYLDRRGSGLNSVDRGDSPGFGRLLDDIRDYIQQVQGGGSPIPVILIAVSWGGKLAAAFCRRHPGLIDGLALLCPGIKPKVGPRLKERLKILWSRLVRPKRPFAIPLNDPELFTANPEKQQFIAQDPLSLREATARFLVGSARLDWYLRFVPKWVTVPVLLMLAEHDRIIDNARTRRYVNRFVNSRTQVIEYAGAHHTLEFEPQPDRFIDELIAWLRQHERPLVKETQPAATSTAKTMALNLGIG